MLKGNQHSKTMNDAYLCRNDSKIQEILNNFDRHLQVHPAVGWKWYQSEYGIRMNNQEYLSVCASKEQMSLKYC